MKTATLIPRREIKARIESAKLHVPSDDQIDRWHAEGLMCEPPSPGKPLAYGYTEAQAQRLFHIAWIVTALASKRPRTCEIAFWLCYNHATDIPPELVCEHIETSIKALQSRMLGALNELGRRNEAYNLGSSGTARKLGDFVAKYIFLKLIPGMARKGLGREATSIILGLVLRATVKPLRFEEAERDVRKVTTAMRGNPEPPTRAVVRDLISIISDFSQLLRLDEQNTMLRAIRALAATPADVFRVVEDTRNSLAVATRFFPWMTDASAASFLGNEDRKFVARYFVPALCGAMTTLRDNEHAQGLAAELRAGNTERATAEWGQAKQLSAYVANRLNLKGIENEQQQHSHC